MSGPSAAFDLYRSRIEADLERFLDPTATVEPKLTEAMRYSLLAGGKRIRPMLLLATVDAFGADSRLSEEASMLASALEMIHTYSLIHDDLPSMDNDMLRRGKPTNHIRFGEATAILAGDALLNRAYELLLEAVVSGGEAVALAGAKIALYAGARGMIGGQIIDLASEGQSITLRRLEELQRLKTGGLLRAAMCAGGLLRGANPEVMDLLDSYGETLGLAFQIKDDILDFTSDAESMGKTVGKDLRDTKSTFVTMLGLDTARERLVAEHKRADAICDLLQRQGLDTQFLLWLGKWLSSRDS